MWADAHFRIGYPFPLSAMGLDEKTAQHRVHRFPPVPTGSHRSHESFVAREAKKVDVFYSNGDVPDGLAGIDAQGYVIFTAQSGDLFQRGEATRNVAGGGQHEEVGAQRQ